MWSSQPRRELVTPRRVLFGSRFAFMASVDAVVSRSNGCAGVGGNFNRDLTREEIKVIWQATRGETRATRGAFRLALLTDQRIGSVRALRRDGITGDLWTIPPEHFKGKRTHLVPLSLEALEVIRELKKVADSDTWVFPSRSKATRPHLTNIGSSLSRVRKKTLIPSWTVHDFRTTFRTHAVRAIEDGGLAIPAHVADAVLGHKEATLGFERYTGDRDRYHLHEKRDAQRKWGAFITAAVEAES